MNFLPLLKVYCIRDLWKRLFFDRTNGDLPCKQKITTYGFNSIIRPGPLDIGYEEFSMTMNVFLPPWAPSDTMTNYNLPISKAIMTIMASLLPIHGHLNNCLLLFSDGGNPPIIAFTVTLYKFVRDWVKHHPLNRCTCVQCFYVGTSSIGYSQFANTCKKIDAPTYNGNCYNMGMQLVNFSADKISKQGSCFC